MITENQKIELFDEFYKWLEADGLKAKKSERLHRKKIFASLIADKKMTLDNFNDFLSYKQEDDKRKFIMRIENLKGEFMTYKNERNYIENVEINEDEEKFSIYFDNKFMVLKFNQLEEIEKIIRQCERS
ncbi:hypothetical protein AAX29_02055 [Aliarcobacter thereius]|uniref:Uncharacterized protein n=1 Tax=Aliarcobacter thereius TaxID=544718 RepID=A0A1C0B2K6_9BACT|nr:hypothetical protein [Aliarcobacter thereius]OCL96516.1 hypothetical protein AAX29_02055 [Aliarcobacter thereius]